MTDRALQHRRLHNLLLIQKLLSLRGDSSPFTLVLDTVEQSAKPLIRHFLHNAKISKIDVVYISYETPRPPPGTTTFIKARRKDAATVQKEIQSAIRTDKRTLLIIDTLYPLASTSTSTSTTSPSLSALLSTLLTTTPLTTLLATYHTDIPLPHSLSPQTNPYAPSPLTTLEYLATTIFTTHRFAHVLARKRAADRSLPEPAFGLGEARDGVLIGLAGDAGGGEGKDSLVVEMCHRRKSGRGVEETYFLPAVSSTGKGNGGKIILLDDHALFRRPELEGPDEGAKAEEGGVGMLTFDLGITAKQRRDREGVVLPYFDAQKEGVDAGEGGRILYDMGVEDDFDEEEDEI